MADPLTRVLIALSGGSDSVALAYLAGELAAAGDIVVAGLAHFNHMLRDTADRDEQFCRDLAHRLGWPIVVDREDVAARANAEKRSLEDAARTARHAFLERARAQLDAGVIAVGHTRDDQAETFLLRLLRGAGSRGLASMHPRNGAIVRPLLECRRRELRAYLAERQIRYVDDETNDDVTIARNRVRAELLPLLETRFNPNIVETLAAEADIARDEWLWMSAAAGALDTKAARREPDGAVVVVLELKALAAAPAALRRMVVWNGMTEAAAGCPISFGHVARALRLMESERDGGFDAPGHRVERIGDRLVLTSRPPGIAGRWRPTPTNLFQYPLSIPGEVVLREAGCAISAEPISSSSGIDVSAIVGTDAASGRGRRIGQSGADVAIVRRDLCRGALSVRNRRPGDRFRPAPRGPRKKLQDFFVDKKTTRDRRDRVPIVVDEHGRIVWVAGYAIDTAFRVTDPAQGMLILRLTRV